MVPGVGTENRERFSLFGQIVNKGQNSQLGPGSYDTFTRYQLLALHLAAKCLQMVLTEALWPHYQGTLYCNLSSEQYELSEIQAQYLG